MAQSAQISTKNDTTKIVVDGNEVHDVVSYTVSSSADAMTKLVLEIVVLNDLEVQIE